MNIALVGYGRMGRMVEACARAAGDCRIVGIVDAGHLASLRDVPQADVAIDFSFPGDMPELLDAARARRIPLVIGRTGLSDAHAALIGGAAADIPIVWADNFSVGVTVMRRMVRQMAKALGDAADVELIEAHHRGKQDAPSGTAKCLLRDIDPAGRRPVLHGRQGAAAHVPGGIGVHAVRGGTVCGEHTVRFLCDMEELSIVHRAESREIFAMGALRAARFVVSQPPGLYGMEDVLFSPRGAEGEE